MDIAGITLVGVNAENGQKLLYSIIFFVIILLLQRGLRLALQQLYLRRPSDRLRFWMIQGTNIATLLLFVLGFLSIWFDDPTRLATGIGLVSAGVAFAAAGHHGDRRIHRDSSWGDVYGRGPDYARRGTW